MINLTLFFNANDVRKMLRAPGIQDGFVYATDGKIGVRISEETEHHPKAKPVNNYPDLDKVMKDHCVCGDDAFSPLPKIDPVDYPSCSVDGNAECDVCHGDGEHECSACEDVHDCGACAGLGKMPSPFCRECHCNKKKDAVIDGVRIQWKYYLAIASLPSPTIAIESNKKSATFRFDGGMGIVWLEGG